MISIQDGAKQIYSGELKPFYFFTGPEYGVKKTYIDVLINRFSGLYEYHSSISDLIKIFKKKSLVPREDKVYIVRYDKSFVSNIDVSLKNVKIPGVIIAIYQDDKDEGKLDKVFPDNVLRINALTDNVMHKHLSSKFSDLPPNLISEVIRVSPDYYSAEMNCGNLMCLPKSIRFSLSQNDIEQLFGHKDFYDVEKFKQAVAARDVRTLFNSVESFEGELSLLLYDILATLLEITKVLDRPYTESFVKPYVQLWDIASVKYMYEVAYDQLQKLRNYSTYLPMNSLLYTCSLLKFKLA